jgi:hypothetical protein
MAMCYVIIDKMVSILVINSYNAQDYNLVSLFIIYSFGEERATYNIGDVYNRCYTGGYGVFKYSNVFDIKMEIQNKFAGGKPKQEQ